MNKDLMTHVAPGKIPKHEPPKKQNIKPKVLFLNNVDGCLTIFLSKSVCSLLYKSIEELLILRGIYRLHGIFPVQKNIVYKNLDERFGEKITEGFRSEEELNYMKLQYDVGLMILILRECMSEIKDFGTFLNVREMLRILVKTDQDNEHLVIKEAENRKILDELKETLAKEKEYFLATLEDTIKQIHILKFKLEDVTAYCNHELEYVAEFDNARKFQNDLILNCKQDFYKNIISDTQKKIEHENRVNEEISNYLEETKNDYQESIEYWMKEYDDELDKKEQELVRLKAKYERMLEDHVALKEEHQRRKTEMADWKAYKQAKKEREEREALELWATLTLQVFWRYYIRKRNLIKPKKDKKGKNKK